MLHHKTEGSLCHMLSRRQHASGFDCRSVADKYHVTIHLVHHAHGHTQKVAHTGSVVDAYR